MIINALAQAEAIQKIAAELQKEGGEKAAQLALAQDYVSMYGEMGAKSNTMFFNQNPGDVTSMLVQAASALTAVPNAVTKTDDKTSSDLTAVPNAVTKIGDKIK